MPLLFGFAVLIVLALRVGEQVLPERLWNGPFYGTLIGIAEDVLRYFCLTPVMMAIHRFIIRGDVTRSYTIDPDERSFLLFFTWTTTIAVLFSLVMGIGEALVTAARASGQSPLIALAFSIAGVIVAIWIAIRLIVLFPAIAVEASGASATNAFADTSGYDLRLLAILLLGLIHWIVLSVFILALGRKFRVPGSLLSMIDLIVGSVVATAVMRDEFAEDVEVIAARFGFAPERAQYAMERIHQWPPKCPVKRSLKRASSRTKSSKRRLAAASSRSAN